LSLLLALALVTNGCWDFEFAQPSWLVYSV